MMSAIPAKAVPMNPARTKKAGNGWSAFATRCWGAYELTTGRPWLIPAEPCDPFPVAPPQVVLLHILTDQPSGRTADI